MYSREERMKAIELYIKYDARFDEPYPMLAKHSCSIPQTPAYLEAVFAAMAEP